MRHIVILSILLISITAQELKFAMAIHSGAIDDERAKFSKEMEIEFKEGLKNALRAGYDVLKNKGSRLDAIQAALESMENNPTFNSGRGAKVIEKCQCELDSAIMDGKTLKCGAVASVQRIKNPIKAARKVMEETRHVLLVGNSADEFAERVSDLIEYVGGLCPAASPSKATSESCARHPRRSVQDPARCAPTAGTDPRILRSDTDPPTGIPECRRSLPWRLNRSTFCCTHW